MIIIIIIISSHTFVYFLLKSLFSIFLPSQESGSYAKSIVLYGIKLITLGVLRDIIIPDNALIRGISPRRQCSQSSRDHYKMYDGYFFNFIAMHAVDDCD